MIKNIKEGWIIILVLVIITIVFRLATYYIRLGKSVTPF